MIWRCDLLPEYQKYKKEINTAIQRVLNSGRYTLGDEVKKFEEQFANYFKIKYAISVANGTDAIILSLKALDIGTDDEIITTPFTAIPTVSAIIAVGAKPVFVDIDPETYLVDINQIQKAITKKTKAIMPVHLFGNVVDIKKIRKIVGKKIFIIEDACQAHGSKIEGIFAGTLGDIGTFSFYPTKNIGGYGDGGMIVTNNTKIAKKLKLLRMYGMVDKDHIVINGINSRLDELQAAILSIKLKHLEETNDKRQIISQKYIQLLNPKLLTHQMNNENIYHNYHVFASKVNKNRNKLMRYLDLQNIQTNIYYPLPLHLQKANKFLNYKLGDFPIAEELSQKIIALPMYPELTSTKTDFIIKKINNFS